ncbi:MAG: ATP-binding protein [Deltaproteobacteria bacterium]|nr:ATP-binding protein [Deltaproteobacteria bacterium]
MSKPKFPLFCGPSSRDLSPKARYRCMRNSLLIVMLAITLIPLSITSGLNFIQYQQLLREDSQANARWNAESARATISAYLEKLEAAITVVIDSYAFEDLSDSKKLEQIFRQLKKEHQGLVDLSVVGPDGIQSAYVGPYGDLVGKDYSDSLWFHKALTRRMYVSEVFTGFRNVPHFVVAASKKDPYSEQYWVLRASIDTETLDRFLALADTEALEDIFLINDSGKLQSASRYHGGAIEEMRGDSTFYRAVSRIQNTPWLLVLDQQGAEARKIWHSFKARLLLTLSLCFLASGGMVVWLSRFLAGKFREADETRDAILSETEHSNKLASIGRLAAGVAHEINNPLAIIGEKAGLMQDLVGLDKDFRHREKFLDQLGSLQNAVVRARTITHRLLGFARRMETSLTLVQLNEILQEVLSFLEKDAAYRNIHVILQLQENLPVIRADHGQLQQVFLNVINNAIDAIRSDGEIHITSRRENNKTVMVAISDTGPGIAPDVLKNIFEPFFTTKGNEEKQGTGLGLSITYGLVQKMGGKIEVSSEVGVGTTFIITFPVYSEGSEGESNDRA